MATEVVPLARPFRRLRSKGDVLGAGLQALADSDPTCCLRSEDHSEDKKHDDQRAQKADDDGQQPCDTINETMLEIMPFDKFMLLILAARKMSQLGPITLSTACSGTDLVVACLLRLMPQIALYTGHSVSIEHVWSCESEAWKRAWITINTSVPTIFQDLFQIHGQKAINQDGHLEAVADSLWFIAGFSCKSLSKLNRWRSTYANCIEQGCGTTGSTFAGVCAFLRKRLPLFLILENVASMGKHNIEEVIARLRDIGYHCTDIVMNARLHGLPMSRQRVYFIGCLVPSKCQQRSEQLKLQRFAEQIEMQLRVDPLPLSKFLLPEEHPLFQSFIQDFTKRPRKLRRTSNWEEKHKAIFEKNNVVWSANSKHIEDFPYAIAFSDRQLSVFHYNMETVALGSHADQYIWDANLSIDFSGRCAPKVSLSCCLTGSSIPIIRWGNSARSCRPLLGPEALQLQGLMASDCPGILGFTNGELWDLSGNAFSGGCANTAAMILMLAFAEDIPSSASEVQQRRRDAAS